MFVLLETEMNIVLLFIAYIVNYGAQKHEANEHG